MGMLLRRHRKVEVQAEPKQSKKTKVGDKNAKEDKDTTRD